MEARENVWVDSECLRLELTNTGTNNRSTQHVKLHLNDIKHFCPIFTILYVLLKINLSALQQDIKNFLSLAPRTSSVINHFCLCVYWCVCMQVCSCSH